MRSLSLFCTAFTLSVVSNTQQENKSEFSTAEVESGRVQKFVPRERANQYFLMGMQAH
jgi:hypothetical protein